MRRTVFLVVHAVTIVSAVCVKKSMKGIRLTDLGLSEISVFALKI